MLRVLHEHLRAATFDWLEDNGTQTGSPTKGTTRTTGRTETNWKNIDDSTTAYSSNPITAGNNSYQKPQFGKYSGSFNQILTGKFAKTSASSGSTMGTGLTLKGVISMTADADRWLYTTPATTTDTNLSTDMTTDTAIGSGVTVWFGATGPEATGKAASMTTNPCYTNFLTTQLISSGSAGPGDTVTATLTLRYNEN